MFFELNCRKNTIKDFKKQQNLLYLKSNKFTQKTPI